MSGSIESVRWNTHEHRLDLSSKRISGNGVRTHVNSNGKIPSTGKIPLRGRSNQGTASSRTVSPTHYQGAIQAPVWLFLQTNTLSRSYSGPSMAVSTDQHTTKELFRPQYGCFYRPTHYQGAIQAPVWLFLQTNTLPRSYSGPSMAVSTD